MSELTSKNLSSQLREVAAMLRRSAPNNSGMRLNPHLMEAERIVLAAASALEPPAPASKERTEHATLSQCPFCERPADSEGGIWHAANCEGLKDAGINKLQYRLLEMRSTPEPPATASKEQVTLALALADRVAIDKSQGIFLSEREVALIDLASGFRDQSRDTPSQHRAALTAAWNALNELRRDAQEAEDRAFEALDRAAPEPEVACTCGTPSAYLHDTGCPKYSAPPPSALPSHLLAQFDVAAGYLIESRVPAYVEHGRLMRRCVPHDDEPAATQPPLLDPNEGPIVDGYVQVFGGVLPRFDQVWKCIQCGKPPERIKDCSCGRAEYSTAGEINDAG